MILPLTDPDAINRILSDPWIAPKFRHDDREPGYIEHPALTYYGAWIDGEMVGLFMAFRVTSADVEVHAALLRKALPHGRELGREFLAMMFADPRLLRVTALVIGNLTSAVNYCRKLGFEVEGVRRDACFQNSRPVDVIGLGLLRANWANIETREAA